MNILSCLLLVSVLAAGDPYRNYERGELPTGALYVWGWSPAAVERLRQTIPAALRNVERRLGKRLRHPFTSVLTPDGATFREVVESISGGARVADSVVGVAVPSARTLVIRGGLMHFGTTFRETLHHEIAHLVIHAGRSTPVPRWLDEGVAMWVSDHRLTAADEAFVALRARLGRLRRLESLAEEFPSAHAATMTAYIQSLLFVTFLVETRGPEVIPQLVEQVRADNTAAVLRVLTGKPLEELELDFASWVTRRTSFFWPLSLVWNIWTLAALLAVAAIVRSRLRRRRMMRRLEELEDDPPETAGRRTEA